MVLEEHETPPGPPDTAVQTKWFSVTLDPRVVEGIIGMHKSMRGNLKKNLIRCKHAEKPRERRGQRECVCLISLFQAGKTLISCCRGIGFERF